MTDGEKMRYVTISTTLLTYLGIIPHVMTGKEGASTNIHFNFTSGISPVQTRRLADYRQSLRVNASLRVTSKRGILYCRYTRTGTRSVARTG
jgi:hypothetical protein